MLPLLFHELLLEWVDLRLELAPASLGRLAVARQDAALILLRRSLAESSSPTPSLCPMRSGTWLDGEEPSDSTGARGRTKSQREAPCRQSRNPSARKLVTRRTEAAIVSRDLAADACGKLTARQPRVGD
jgi:hypothetical protein